MPEISNPRAAPRRRRPLTLRRRLGNALLGALSGAVAGWLAVVFAEVEGVLPRWIIGVLAALGAAFGYRYGRGVVAATFKALGEADGP